MKTKNSVADNIKHVFIETFKVDDLCLSSFVRYCQFNHKQNRLIIQYKYTCAKNQIFNLKSFVELQSDRIVNVRLQLSETLALLYEKNERLERMPEEDKDSGK